ncbi:uncharacterized protein LOC131432518 isoform X2 [Malaya genurostris]|uniref:uncharacterized protein LOC131432518 isoform X2 n=1 Tax=Malaya genurostris TaxID=325434 RepID=UPI0026F4084B|nr:uncharacterized protein LOC131432518 isoform X2 [Malaya genurostris]
MLIFPSKKQLLVSQKKNWMFSTHGVPLSSYAYGVLMNLPDVFSFAAGISNLVVKRQRVFQAGYLLIIALDEATRLRDLFRTSWKTFKFGTISWEFSQVHEVMPKVEELLMLGENNY